MVVMKKIKQGNMKKGADQKWALDQVVREYLSEDITFDRISKEPAMKRTEGRKSFPGGGKSLMCSQNRIKGLSE